MILYPLRKPVPVELDDSNQQITFGRKKVVNTQAGFMGFVDVLIHFIV
jgi:hypothetical protein